MSYTDAMYAAIQHRFARDILESYKLVPSRDVLSLVGPKDRVTVPLRAEVAIAYEKGLAAFTLDARVHDTGDDWICARECFSTLEFKSHRDRSGLLNCIFDHLREDFLRHLAEGELNRILGVNNKE